VKFFFPLQAANVAYLKKNPIIQIFCISGWLAVPINLDKWSSIVLRNKRSVKNLLQ